MPEHTVSPNVDHYASGEPLSNQRPARTRNRTLLSCIPCRERKLRCDRQNPCDNCIKATTRGDPTLCQYTRSQSKNQSTTESCIDKDVLRSLDETRHRVKRLEEQITSLRAERGQQQGYAHHLDTDMTLALDTVSRNALDDLSTVPQGNSIISCVIPGRQSSSSVDGGDGLSHSAEFSSDPHWFAIIADIVEARKHFKTYEHAKNASVAIRAVIKQFESCDQSLHYSCKCSPKRKSSHLCTTSGLSEQKRSSSYDDLFVNTNTSAPFGRNAGSEVSEILSTSPGVLSQDRADEQLATNTRLATCDLSAISNAAHHQSGMTGWTQCLDANYDYCSYNQNPLGSNLDLCGIANNVFGNVCRSDDWVRISLGVISGSRFI
jgi:hypothetical protein